MKSISIFVCIMMLVASPLFSQEKVVERSTKRVPKWCQTQTEGYLIVSAVEPDMEAAKQRCLEYVRKQILESVALNVEISTASSMGQEVKNDLLDSFEKTVSNSTTNAAKIPFLSGISMIKAEDAYWEKRVDKKQKKTSYYYCIKYPFSQYELQTIIADFNRQDRKQVEKLMQLEKDISSVASLEQIDASIVDLEGLKAYFFDSARKTKTTFLQQSYYDLYDRISVETKQEKAGECKLGLNLNGRSITTSRIPTYKTNCASQIVTAFAGDTIIVRYDYKDCLLAEENFIEATFYIGSKRIRHKININVAQDILAVNVKDKVIVSVNDKKLIVNLYARYATSFYVESLTLEFPEKQLLRLGKIDKLYTGAGDHSVEIGLSQEQQSVLEQVKKTGLIKGRLVVRQNTKTGSVSIPFMLSYLIDGSFLNEP